jgi:hypothetical protein
MSAWADAGAVIDAAFADEEPLIYTGAGLAGAEISAIRSDVAAQDFDGPGKTLRRVTYEIGQADLPQRPDKTNSFIHRGRTWKVEDVTKRDDIGKWELVVVDLGPAQ